MTRRKFSKLFALAASLLLLPGLQCNQEASDLLTSLRGIVKSVETALAALALLGGLLPDVVNEVAKYLLAVLKFVDDVAALLEDETKSAADKARQILSWASGLVVPKLSPPVSAIVAAVAAAVDAFLSHFGANVENAGAQSRAVASVPNLKLSANDRTFLAAIEAQATADSLRVEEWAEKHGVRTSAWHKPVLWQIYTGDHG